MFFFFLTLIFLTVRVFAHIFVIESISMNSNVHFRPVGFIKFASSISSPTACHSITCNDQRE